MPTGATVRESQAILQPGPVSSSVSRNIGYYHRDDASLFVGSSSDKLMLVPLGKILIGTAALFFVVGLVVLLIGKLGINRVPGDIVIQRGKLTVFFPIVSCLLISLVLSLIMTMLGRLRR